MTHQLAAAGVLCISRQDAMAALNRLGFDASQWERDARRDRRGFVYLARDPDGKLKIGWSKEPVGRVRAICGPTGKRHTIETVIGDVSFVVEKAIHTMLRSERVVSEWFRGPMTESLVSDLTARSVTAVSPDHFIESDRSSMYDKLIDDARRPTS